MVQVRKIALMATAPAGALLQSTATPLMITPSTCADPAGFEACLQPANQKSLVCSAKAGSDADALLTCGCELDLAEIDCALQSCWNVVYGCDYQTLGVQWDYYCLGNLQDIPFFPAPDNAPGGCSCNLGQILGYIKSGISVETTCTNNAQTTGDLNKQYACSCCQISATLTSLYSFCPDISPLSLGYGDISSILNEADASFGNCAASFAQYDCVNDLGYPPIGTVSYLTVLPASTGTASPTTTGGSIASPLCETGCVVSVYPDTTIYNSPAVATAAVSSSSFSSGGGAATTESSQPTAASESAGSPTTTMSGTSNGSESSKKSGNFFIFRFFLHFLVAMFF